MKKALVLGGGGSKGAYEIGVWKALDELDQHFDIVCGTSIGAMIGVLYVQQEYDTAYELWSNLTIDDVMLNGIDLDMDIELIMSQKGKYKAFLESFVEHKGADITPFYNMIHRLYDPEKFFNSPIDYGCMCVNVSKRSAAPFLKKDMKKDTVLDYVMASASCYPAFPMKIINEEKYVDGGYADNLPIKLAQEMGAEEIVAVDLKSVGRNVVKGPMEHLIYIEPQVSLGSFLLFDHERIMQNMQLGYLDTMKKFHRLLGSVYTFPLHDEEAILDFEEEMQEGFAHLKEEIETDKMHLLTEKITSLSLLIGLNKFHIYDAPFTAMLEKAAQAFSFDYHKIYDFQDFKYQLLKVVQAYTPDIQSGLSDSDNIKRLLHNIKDIHLAELICVNFYYLLKDEKNIAVVWLLATMTNDSFLIAYLLYLMYKQQN